MTPQDVANGKRDRMSKKRFAMPYGETWINNKATAEQTSSPYKFTAKEYDEETGLYYYGARYYDAKLSRWVSADPPLARGDYLPTEPVNDKAKEHNGKLPGMGGVFNTINMNAYHYAGDNPVKYIDPDGQDIYLIVGGVSVNDPGGHDTFAFNFLNAVALRVKNLRNNGYDGPINVIMYTPSYERRAIAEGKTKNYYLNIMKNSAKRNNFNLIAISSSDELTNYLNSQGKGQIEMLEYFGHSNSGAAFLEYSSIPGHEEESTDSWGKSDVSKLKVSLFAKNAKVNLYGCYQGLKNGLADHFNKHLIFSLPVQRRRQIINLLAKEFGNLMEIIKFFIKKVSNKYFTLIVLVILSFNNCISVEHQSNKYKFYYLIGATDENKYIMVEDRKIWIEFDKNLSNKESLNSLLNCIRQINRIFSISQT